MLIVQILGVGSYEKINIIQIMNDRYYSYPINLNFELDKIASIPIYLLLPCSIYQTVYPPN